MFSPTIKKATKMAEKCTCDMEIVIWKKIKKFYGRHTDLVGQYKKNICQMFADSIS